ncbi:hypothetical protein BKA63DRAFT_566868 [Paraphoma chrysanthemicola]|nr:hypothetical protein BKA63DRAFT_566868 [Paraphoma chrysanthemicola]
MAAPTAGEVAAYLSQKAFTTASIRIARAPVEIALGRTFLAMPLLAKAGLLTSFLIRGTALPDFLEQHGRVLFAFTTGVAAATGIYHYFRHFRENRAKVQLGVYHIVRQLENLPDLYERLNNPIALVADIDTEVTRMIGVHLTKNEAADVLLQVKRKLWVCVDERREAMKRQKKVPREDTSINSSPKLPMPCSSSVQPTALGTLPVAMNHPSNNASNMQIEPPQEDEQDVIMTDVGHLPAAPVETQLNSSPPLPPSQVTDRSSYQVPTSSSEESKLSSPPPAPPPPHQLTPALWQRTSPPSSGYGLNYDDDNLYSPESPIEQRQKRSENAKEPSMLERATKRAFDPNAFGNRPYESPVLPPARTTEPSATIKSQASKPFSTVKMQQPPNTLALRSRNAKKGTWLKSVQEGASPQHGPTPGTTEYRVAERRDFYNGIQENRRIRRTFRTVFEAVDDVKKEEVNDVKEERCADAILPFVATSEDEIATHFDPASSPPLPLKEPRTPELSSPRCPPTPEWPSSGINFSPFTSPAVVSVASSPVTPDQKRNRPRKNSLQP